MTIYWSGEEILEMAVQIEKNGVDFYLELAESAKDDNMRGLMQYLAEEEKKHMAIFRKLSGVSDQEHLKNLYELQYGEEGRLYLKALADTKIFADSNEAAHWARGAENPSEALGTAIDLEKDSILFYQEMRNFVRADDRNLVDEIINEEKKHIQTLATLKKECLS